MASTHSNEGGALSCFKSHGVVSGRLGEGVIGAKPYADATSSDRIAMLATGDR